MEYIGRSGWIGGYQVAIGENRVEIAKDGIVIADQTVPPLDGRAFGEVAATASDLRISWGRLPSGNEAIAIYDGANPRASFIVDLSDPANSSWGPAPLEWTSGPALS